MSGLRRTRSLTVALPPRLLSLALKMKRLTNPEEIEDARRRLAELLEARGEWFLREGRAARAVELRRGEWELRVASGALTFSYRGEAGARAWRVAAWER